MIIHVLTTNCALMNNSYHRSLIYLPHLVQMDNSATFHLVIHVCTVSSEMLKSSRVKRQFEHVAYYSELHYPGYSNGVFLNGWSITVAFVVVISMAVA